MVDALLDFPSAPHEKVQNDSFFWPSFMSSRPYTFEIPSAEFRPSELHLLPSETRRLHFFGTFMLAYDENNQVLGVLRNYKRATDGAHQAGPSPELVFSTNIEEDLKEEFNVTEFPENIYEKLSRLPAFIQEDGPYYTKLIPEGFHPHHKLVLEQLIHLEHLWSNYPDQRQAIHTILSRADYHALEMLVHLETDVEIALLAQAATTIPQETLIQIAGQIESINALEMEFPWEDEAGKTPPERLDYLAFAKALTREILLDMIDNPNLNRNDVYDGYILAFKALSAVGYLIVDPEIAHEIFAQQTLAHQEESAHKYANAITDPRNSLALVPIVMYWTKKLGNHAPADMNPEATRVFYETLTNLNKLANETTGDTEQELALLKEHLSALDLPKDFSWLDAGSGDGERILRPLIDWFQTQNHTPNVIAADLLAYPLPADGAWRSIQADISGQYFLDHLATDKIDLVTLTWSVFNDLTGPQRMQALTNFNQALKLEGHIVFDVTVDYQTEEADYREQNPHAPPGSFTRDFRGPNGVSVGKGFQAARPAIMHGELAKSGFRVIKAISYTTKAGYQRKLVIAQKISEPLPNPPNPW